MWVREKEILVLLVINNDTLYMGNQKLQEFPVLFLKLSCLKQLLGLTTQILL